MPSPPAPAPVTLHFDGAPSARPPAPRVTLTEPMLGYRCNRMGCCCGGWRIPLRPDDLVRMRAHLSPEDAERAVTDVELRVEPGDDGERVVREVYLTGDDGWCRFLDADRHGCTLHSKYGLGALPDLCVDFPVAVYDSGGGVDFCLDPVCPAVLDAIDAGDPHVRIVERPAPYDDAAFARRAAHSRGVPVVRVGAAALEAPQLDVVRRRVMEALATDRPVWEHLHAIDAAYAELAHGRAPADFRVEYGRDPGPYLRFLRDCIGAHGTGTLVRVFDTYRRFVFSLPLGPNEAPWAELGDHLAHWDRAFERWLAPQDDLLRPLQLKYLAHRHFAPFLTIRGELKFAAGAIVHAFATSLRYAAAIGAVLRRPVDPAVFKVALGCGEYVYRSLEIPPDSLPWFGVLD